ncbi:MAG: D-2-hydroxyacid dehydrogenase [bacterium]|nr:D-2-hydroxyacid dehydrogenase [bacterium]
MLSAGAPVSHPLLTAAVAEASQAEIEAISGRTGTKVKPRLFVGGTDLPAAEREEIEVAFASPDLVRMGAFGPFFDLIESLPGLQWLHLGFAGIDNPRFGAMLDREVRLSNSPGAAAEPIAHTAMAGLLSLARRLPHYHALQREHRWRSLPVDEHPTDLSTQTLVIYGLGTIGGELARLARAFGLRVIGVRRSPGTDRDPADEVVHPDALDAVLPRADWLAVTANLTRETRGAIDAHRLALLPEGAHVINVARGRIIDESALIDALRSKRIAGAYLDVFEVEPLPAESPLWDMPDVIVTPRASWTAQGNFERARLIFLDNLETWLQRGELKTEVCER